jgi:predicted flap endonuclease-1-like 5' DNA nuclease
MSLLDKLKSLLGLESSESSGADRRDVGVTVERESGRETDAGTERAVKESADDGAGAATTDGTEPDAADADADGREPAETAGVEAGGEATAADTDGGATAEAGAGDGASVDADSDAEADSGADAEEPRVPSEAVDVIKGIGPTYAGRLSDAGVETVDDLAAADAADLASRADVPEGRVENWIEKAKSRTG